MHFVHKYGSFYVESAQKQRHILLNHTEYPKNSYKTVTKNRKCAILLGGIIFRLLTRCLPPVFLRNVEFI